MQMELGDGIPPWPSLRRRDSECADLCNNLATCMYRKSDPKVASFAEGTAVLSEIWAEDPRRPAILQNSGTTLKAAAHFLSDNALSVTVVLFVTPDPGGGFTTLEVSNCLSEV